MHHKLSKYDAIQRLRLHVDSRFDVSITVHDVYEIEPDRRRQAQSGYATLVVRSQVFSVEPETPTLCNFKVSKNYKKARQVGYLANPYL